MLDGSTRAAIVLMTVGEERAAEIIRSLGPREVQKLGAAMSALEGVSAEDVNEAVSQFGEAVREQTGIGIGSEDYVRNVMTSALGEDRASSVLGRILSGGRARGLDSLKWMDARAIVDLVRYEHPQIIAIILSNLDPDLAAEVLTELPEELQGNLMLRVATMDGVQPAAIQELNEMLETHLRGSSGSQQAPMGGVKCAAAILNLVDRSIEGRISEYVTKTDATLADEIQDLMFTFDNLSDVDDKGIQTLLRDISADNLVIALKGTDSALQEKIFRNMSQRAADMLRDDLEAKGPVRVSEVEAAQKEILGIARRLADEGTIALGGSGEDMV